MNVESTLRQESGTVEENALRIDQDKAEQIIEALNTDLAATYVLYHQLRKHHWNVAGAEYQDLHDWFDAAAEDAEDNADELAERVQALGGVPISGMSSLEENAPVESEGDDIYDIRTSMSNDLELYGDIIEAMREHVSLAENLGDFATGEMLRDQLEDLEDDAHEIEHFLEDDTLVLEEATH